MDDGADELSYRSLPLRDDYPRSLALPIIITVVSLGTGFSFGSLGLGALAAAMLLIMLARYFVPTEYTLDASGVRVRLLGRETRRPWTDVHGFYPHRDGVHLSPFERPSALDPFRGLYIRFTGNRAEVLSFLERHVERHARGPA